MSLSIRLILFLVFMISNSLYADQLQASAPALEAEQQIATRDVQLSGIISDAEGTTLKDAVLWIEIPGVKPSREPRVEKMIQRDKEFVPHVMVAPVNTEVWFPNLDKIYHNIFSYNKVKNLNLGQYKGKGTPVMFEETGIYPIGCEIHPWMSAFIVVVDTPFFAKSGLTGNYRFRQLVSGNYTLKVWATSLKETVELPVEVKEGKQEFNVVLPMEAFKRRKKKKKKVDKKKGRYKYY